MILNFLDKEKFKLVWDSHINSMKVKQIWKTFECKVNSQAVKYIYSKLRL